MALHPADKVLLLHPDDYDRLKDGGLPIIRDQHGVCKPGHGYELKIGEPAQSEMLMDMRRLLDRIQDDGPAVQLPSSFRYGPSLRMPSLPKFLSLDLGVDPPFQVPPVVRLSLKQRARAQRRLDRHSNVRRRKRWAELAQMSPDQVEREKEGGLRG